MKFLDHLEEWLITFLMAAATIVVFVAVVHRYVSARAIESVDETLASEAIYGLSRLSRQSMRERSLSSNQTPDSNTAQAGGRPST